MVATPLLRDRVHSIAFHPERASAVSASADSARPAIHSVLACYDGAIMMARTQITLDPESHRRARQRASDLGISLAEYIRDLVSRDLGSSHRRVRPDAVFNLGSSGGSNIARDKDSMIADAFHSLRAKPGRRRSR